MERFRHEPLNPDRRAISWLSLIRSSANFSLAGFTVRNCPITTPILSQSRADVQPPQWSQRHPEMFDPITCGRPTKLDARFNVCSLSPTFRSTLMANSLEPDRTGISQQTGSRLSMQSAMQRQFTCAWVLWGGSCTLLANDTNFGVRSLCRLSSTRRRAAKTKSTLVSEQTPEAGAHKRWLHPRPTTVLPKTAKRRQRPYLQLRP